MLRIRSAACSPSIRPIWCGEPLTWNSGTLGNFMAVIVHLLKGLHNECSPVVGLSQKCHSEGAKRPKNLSYHTERLEKRCFASLPGPPARAGSMTDYGFLGHPHDRRERLLILRRCTPQNDLGQKRQVDVAAADDD